MPPKLRQPPLFFDRHDPDTPFQPNQPGAGTDRSVDPDQRVHIAGAVSLAITQGRMKMSTYDLMVVTAVLLTFSAFSAFLAFATFEESRRHHSR